MYRTHMYLVVTYSIRTTVATVAHFGAHFCPWCAFLPWCTFLHLVRIFGSTTVVQLVRKQLSSPTGQACNARHDGLAYSALIFSSMRKMWFSGVWTDIGLISTGCYTCNPVQSTLVVVAEDNKKHFLPLAMCPHRSLQFCYNEPSYNGQGNKDEHSSQENAFVFVCS